MYRPKFSGSFKCIEPRTNIPRLLSTILHKPRISDPQPYSWESKQPIVQPWSVKKTNTLILQCLLWLLCFYYYQHHDPSHLHTDNFVSTRFSLLLHHCEAQCENVFTPNPYSSVFSPPQPSHSLSSYSPWAGGAMWRFLVSWLAYSPRVPRCIQPVALPQAWTWAGPLAMVRNGPLPPTSVVIIHLVSPCYSGWQPQLMNICTKYEAI